MKKVENKKSIKTKPLLSCPPRLIKDMTIKNLVRRLLDEDDLEKKVVAVLTDETGNDVELKDGYNIWLETRE